MSFVQSSKNIILSVVTLMVLAGTFLLGFSMGEYRVRTAVPMVFENTDASGATRIDFSPFWHAWNILERKFVSTGGASDRVSDQDKLWGAIQGLAAAYKDPYTVFLPPTQSEIFEDDVRGNFDGVGMEVSTRDGVVTVVAPLKGTPAYRAGIQAGDIITRIDAASTMGMSTEEAVALIRGRRGTSVELTLLRQSEAEPLSVSVMRETIEIPTITTSLLPESRVFVIELYNFSAVSPNLFRNALREFIQTGSDKLILDLRGNPGGYLEASIDMASWFLPPGRPVVIEDFGEDEDEVVYRSKGYDVFTDRLKMAVLIDGGSASASEILAGALSEYGIAVLVGSKTYGKGSVQELVKITPETSLKVTIAKWLTPGKVSISEGGLTPDIEVPRNTDDGPRVDRARNRAVELLLDTAFWEERRAERRSNQ